MTIVDRCVDVTTVQKKGGGRGVVIIQLQLPPIAKNEYMDCGGLRTLERAVFWYFLGYLFLCLSPVPQFGVT